MNPLVVVANIRIDARGASTSTTSAIADNAKLNNLVGFLLGGPQWSSGISLARIHSSVSHVACTDHTFGQPGIGIFTTMKVHLRNLDLHENLGAFVALFEAAPARHRDNVVTGDLGVPFGRVLDWLVCEKSLVTIALMVAFLAL
jgi:hypothetical protein